MPNLNAVLNDQIRRLARREIRAQAKKTRRLTAQHRRDIAELKRQVRSIERAVKVIQRQEKRLRGSGQTSENLNGVRFRADGLRSHRAKLGLSAKDYGRLVGASGLSVYHWEAGKA